MVNKPSTEEMWRTVLTGQALELKRLRHFLRLIPKNPRCKFCNAPFHGIGSLLVKLFLKKRQSIKNPNFCNTCEEFARTHSGGAEIGLTMLFADVRGSTTLAEHMSPSDFTILMNRFYTVANDALIRSDAFIDKLVGDEVIGLYLPGFAGPEHPRLAVEAAKELLQATGHGDTGGPWIPVGVGVHTGVAFVGTVGSMDNFRDFTAMGDAVNITARLASQAAHGEILISENTYKAAHINLPELEQRQLALKGRSDPVNVHVLRVAQNQNS